MKKMICMLLVAFMLVGLFAACVDEGGGKEETVTIIGTWEYSAMNCAYTFKEDGTGCYTFGGSDLPFTYTDDGSKVSIQYENSTDPNVFNYTIEGDTLHIEDSYGQIVDYTKK